VVIAIVSIMAALLMPVLKKARESTQSIVCINNLRQYHIAMSYYSNDNYGYCLPAAVEASGSWWPALLCVNNYLPSEPNLPAGYLKKALKCPSNHNGYASYPPPYDDPSNIYYNGWPNYLYNNTVNGYYANGQDPLRKMSALVNPSQKAMLMEGCALQVYGIPYKCNYVFNHWSGFYDPSTPNYLFLFPHTGRMNILYWDGHINSAKQGDFDMTIGDAFGDL
jgi:prepilin-type processing-associated H-X9-DG protein